MHIECATQGNPGALGDAGAIPQFSRDAFALLGFDEGIDDYCRSRAPFGYKDFLHADRCVAANVNILSLYGVSVLAASLSCELSLPTFTVARLFLHWQQRVPYNICRTLGMPQPLENARSHTSSGASETEIWRNSDLRLCSVAEWQACAARGRLPGQRTPTLRFATSPLDLDPTGMESGKPLGKCRGWLPPQRPSEGYGCEHSCLPHPNPSVARDHGTHPLGLATPCRFFRSDHAVCRVPLCTRRCHR